MLFNEIECRENVGSVYANGDCVLKVGCGLAIFGAAGPAIFTREDNILGTHADHWLDSNDHAFFEQWASAGDTIVGDIGAFVHFETYAMTTELTNDRVAILFTMLLDGMAYITDTVAGFALFETDIECLFGHFQQTLKFGSALATGESIGRIRDVTIQLDDTIKGDVVAFFDEEFVGRDAVHDDIVDRDAKCGRETFIALAKGDAPIVTDILLTYVVKESSCNTRLNMTAHLGKSLAEETGTITYQFYFFFCLEEYHYAMIELFMPVLT